jgi:hypothetical protein
MGRTPPAPRARRRRIEQSPIPRSFLAWHLLPVLSQGGRQLNRCIAPRRTRSAHLHGHGAPAPTSWRRHRVAGVWTYDPAKLPPARNRGASFANILSLVDAHERRAGGNRIRDGRRGRSSGSGGASVSGEPPSLAAPFPCLAHQPPPPLKRSAASTAAGWSPRSGGREKQKIGTQ